jgi:hypothetical protein
MLSPLKFDIPLIVAICLSTAALAAVSFWAPRAAAHDPPDPQGIVEVKWKQQHVRRVFSSGYGDAFGLEISAKQGFPGLETVEGKRCVNGSFFLFDVDDDYAFDLDETVELEILFDRSRSTGFWFGYDRNAVAETAANIEFEKSEARWHREVVTLERARFANRGQGGSDFGIAAPSAMWPGTPDENHRIVICEVKIRRSNRTAPTAPFGELELSITDRSNGQKTAARMGIYHSSGRMPLPSRDALTIYNYNDKIRQIFLRSTHGTITPWPSKNRYIFYASGIYRARLPVGNYVLVASKGPEYRVVERSFAIRSGETLEFEIPLERWAHMPSRRWYSGDDHVHIAREPADNVPIGTFMQAEDLHVTNLLQMGNPDTTYFHQYGWGKKGRFVSGLHALVPGVEDPRTAIRGHTISLNIEHPIRKRDAYLQYDQIFDAYRKQGGLSGYAHVAGALFNVARGVALDVPLGAVDFLEVMQDGILATELWYAFLNLGIRLIPMAGSDFPYLGLPGAERNYVKLPAEFSPDAWYAALKEGQTFVTSGPLLELTVNGKPMGATLSAQPGDRITIQTSARLNPDLEALDRLELIIHGDVVQVAKGDGSSDTISLSHELTLRRGVWIAARAYGIEQTAAHTAPVYVQIDDQSFWCEEKVPEIATAMRERLTELATLTPSPSEELEPWEVADTLTAMWRKQRAHIQQRIQEAHRVYQALSDAASQKRSD